MGVPSKKAASDISRHAWLISGGLCLLVLLVMLANPSARAVPQEQAKLVYQLAQGAMLGAAAASEQRCTVSREYVPSQLEKDWLANAREWEKNFCTAIASHTAAAERWLQALAAHSKLQEQPRGAHEPSPAQALADQQQIDAAIFSRFETTIDCGAGGTRTETTWIEPLSHGLRHPKALCPVNRKGRPVDEDTVMDRAYLLLAHRNEVETLRNASRGRCARRECQSFYFDLGASVTTGNPEEAGQGWFYDAYARQGITFDRYLLWEVKQHKDSDIFRHLPASEVHKYQYYNFPVNTDISSPANPVHILKTITQPDDFVVFKLDIDTPNVEWPTLQALLEDPEALALVDEFYFEDHVNFKDMLYTWDKSVHHDRTLADSYQTFYTLRQRGVRAHSWV